MTPTRSRLGDAAVWTLVALVAVVPLVTGNLTGIGVGRFPLLYDSVALPRFVLSLLGACAVWLLALVASARDGRELRFDPVFAVLLGLAGWALVSDLVSAHRALGVLGQSERLEGVVTMLGYALLYGAALQVVRSVRDVRRIAAGIGVAAAISSAYGISQFLGFDPTNYTVEAFAFSARRAFATFGNPDFLAGLLVIALPCLVVLAWTSAGVTLRVVWGACAATVAVALLVTFTRGGWVAVVVEIVLALVVWRMRGGRASRAALIAAAVSAAVILAIVAASLANPAETNVAARLSDFSSPGGSAGERTLVLYAAVAATSARPLTGWGPDAFLAAFRANRPDDYAQRFTATATIANAHSWPAQIAATVGILGALLLLAALGLALWRGRKFALARAETRFDPLLAAAYIGCAGFVLFMMTSVAVHGSTTPFWVLLGAIGAPVASRRALGRPIALAGVAVSAVAVLLVVVAGASLLAADHAYLQSRLAFRGFSAADPQAEAARATALNPLSIKYARGAAQLEIDRVRQSMAAKAPAAAVATQYRQAAAALDRALAVDSADYASLAWKASLAADVSRYTGDAALARGAVATAQLAAALDRQHAAVAKLAAGDTSPGASAPAGLVEPLP